MALSSVSIQFLRISVRSLLLALFYFLQPTYFTVDLARHMASLNRSEDSKTQRQAFILLHIVFFICICGTHAHCGCFGQIRNTVSRSDLDKHLFGNSFKNRVAEYLPCLLKDHFFSPRDQGDTTVYLTAGGKKDWAVRRHLIHMAPLSYIQKQVDSAYLPLKEGMKVFSLPLTCILPAPHAGTRPSLNLPGG